MTDDLKNRGPADRARINVNEVSEVTYWCKELGCSESQLKAAVRAASSVMVDKVRQQLRNRGLA